MTASTATRLPNPRGTDFVRGEIVPGHPSSFYARIPGSGDIHFLALNDVLEQKRPAQQIANAKALRQIALDALSEPHVTDPNVRYATAVHSAILESLHAADRISTAEE